MNSEYQPPPPPPPPNPDPRIVKSTRVSQFCTSSGDNSESISYMNGILFIKHYSINTAYGEKSETN